MNLKARSFSSDGAEVVVPTRSPAWEDTCWQDHRQSVLLLHHVIKSLKFDIRASMYMGIRSVHLFSEIGQLLILVDHGGPAIVL